MNAAKFYETWPATMNAMKSRAPDLGRSFAPFFQGLMKEGALSVKHKELVALAIGVAVRCDNCIFAHVEKCLKVGATPAEIMEATGVAVMMGGGPVYTYATKVSDALAHFEQPASAGTPN